MPAFLFWVKSSYSAPFNFKFSWQDDVVKKRVSGMVCLENEWNFILYREHSEQNQLDGKIQMLGKTVTDDSRAI